MKSLKIFWCSIISVLLFFIGMILSAIANIGNAMGTVIDNTIMIITRKVVFFSTIIAFLYKAYVDTALDGIGHGFLDLFLLVLLVILYVYVICNENMGFILILIEMIAAWFGYKYAYMLNVIFKSLQNDK